MTGNQEFKHFDSAQCDIRVLATLVLFNTHVISYLQCPPEL